MSAQRGTTTSPRRRMTVFTEHLFASIGGIYAKILGHPFLQGLTSGGLAPEAFKFYVVQDALYLKDFARGLALLGAKAPEDDWAVMFCEHAGGAIVVERALHGSFFKEWGLTPQRVYATPIAPTNLLYTSYLMRVAYDRPFHEAMGAFLPCYWIYWEVGKELERRGSPNPLFQKWINTYASQEFGASVQQVLEAMEQVAKSLTDQQKAAVQRHFAATSRFEYMFWDMGYRRERWKV